MYCQMFSTGFSSDEYEGSRIGAGAQDSMTIDGVADVGQTILFEEIIKAAKIDRSYLYVREIRFERPIEKVEFRARVTGDATWSISIPAIRRL